MLPRKLITLTEREDSSYLSQVVSIMYRPVLGERFRLSYMYCRAVSIHTENNFGRTMGWIKGLTRPLASTREKSISVRRLNRIF